MRTPRRLLRRARGPLPRLAAVAAGLTLGLVLLGPTSRLLVRTAAWARSQPAFQIRTLELAPLQWMEPDRIRARITDAAPATLFDSLEPVRQAVADMAGVRSVQVRRRLPGTLWVRVVEEPLLARLDSGAVTRTGTVVTPRAGVGLPDRTWSGPLTPSALDILNRLTEADPAWLAAVRLARSMDGALAVTWRPEANADPVTLLFGATSRIPSSALLRTVLEDAGQRGAAVGTLDLRYSGQVIARPQ